MLVIRKGTNTNKKYMPFYNFRCRKCFQIISWQTDDDLLNNDVWLISGNNHTNCLQKTMPNEFMVMDLISVSDEPLPSAVDVIELGEN